MPNRPALVRPHCAATSASAAGSRRSRTSGSFHAGEPFPVLSPYQEEPVASSSRRRKSSVRDARPIPARQPTARYHTFPTSPPATPSASGASPQQSYPWYKRLFRTQSQEGDRDAGERDNGAGTTSFETQSIDRDTRDRDNKWIGKGKGAPGDGADDTDAAGDTDLDTTPLPWQQLGLLALLSLAEQTALNSIGPYLPSMVASFDEIPSGEEGLFVGLLASAFALAQLATNLVWGYLSDRVGRKPTMLLGTSLLAGCFVFFGLCTTYVQLLMVHVAMGLLNGNAAIVPTCLGEVTDRTNQSKAFTWLPVIYSLGSITGPALGGLLVGVMGGEEYPFLAPNLLSAALLILSVVVLAVWFEETLEGSDANGAGCGRDRIKAVIEWCAGVWPGLKRRLGVKGRGGQYPVDTRDDQHSDLVDGHDRQGLLDSVSEVDEDDNSVNKHAEYQVPTFRQLVNRNTLAVLGTYLVFQLANISYNSLYPIFASSPLPTGRNLGPGTIGLSLSFAGLATITFQAFLFQRLKARIGNLGTYRYSLLGMALSMSLMPWVGYSDNMPRLGLWTGKVWLYGELGGILILKNICAVGGLSSVMLLITNSAPSHETLGTLNGIAQTLSAAGRSVGPFLSGSIFTLSTRVRPKGEALAWGIFAGITLGGWLGSFAIRGRGLESADCVVNDDDEEEGEEDFRYDDEERGLER
ncbi:MFS general substrate transporter [Canariomyces notabilis]|uniref:MFS general substrate transporter n=1 Tax=Canariomyces notabilis TaxID=2074819 RepID=A0AAN6TNR8_9PEZI|nr:MFS general substrate transporter [Canariomyces arenarius]